MNRAENWKIDIMRDGMFTWNWEQRDSIMFHSLGNKVRLIRLRLSLVFSQLKSSHYESLPHTKAWYHFEIIWKKLSPPQFSLMNESAEFSPHSSRMSCHIHWWSLVNGSEIFHIHYSRLDLCFCWVINKLLLMFAHTSSSNSIHVYCKNFRWAKNFTFSSNSLPSPPLVGY